MASPAEITQGPMLIGFLFNTVLLGIMFTQVYIYFTTFRRDKQWLKLFILLLLICDTANTIFDFIYLYTALVTHFDDEQYLASATWVFATDPALTAIIACLVQMFFAWRIHVLTANDWFVALVAVCSTASAVGGLATAIEVGRVPAFVEFRRFKLVVIIWLASSSAADLTITTLLVWYLRQHKTGLHGSDKLIDRIIRMTVQTGMLTTLCATVDLILFLIYPTGMHLIFNFPLSKLYTNALLSSLNARGGWRYGATQDAELPAGLPLPGVGHRHLRPGIHVHVESLETRDGDSEVGAGTSTSSAKRRPDKIEGRRSDVDNDDAKLREGAGSVVRE